AAGRPGSDTRSEQPMRRHRALSRTSLRPRQDGSGCWQARTDTRSQLAPARGTVSSVAARCPVPTPVGVFIKIFKSLTLLANLDPFSPIPCFCSWNVLGQPESFGTGGVLKTGS